MSITTLVQQISKPPARKPGGRYLASASSAKPVSLPRLNNSWAKASAPRGSPASHACQRHSSAQLHSSAQSAARPTAPRRARHQLLLDARARPRCRASSATRRASLPPRRRHHRRGWRGPQHLRAASSLIRRPRAARLFVANRVNSAIFPSLTSWSSNASLAGKSPRAARRLSSS